MMELARIGAKARLAELERERASITKLFVSAKPIKKRPGRSWTPAQRKGASAQAKKRWAAGVYSRR